MLPNLKAAGVPILNALLVVAGYLVIQYILLNQWHYDPPNVTTEALNRTISLAFGYSFGYFFGRNSSQK